MEYLKGHFNEQVDKLHCFYHQYLYCLSCNLEDMGKLFKYYYFGLDSELSEELNYWFL